MLVLSRKIGETIIINGCIRVTVTALKGDKVRIGVEAPPEVRIDREEVHHRIQALVNTPGGPETVACSA